MLIEAPPWLSPFPPSACSLAVVEMVEEKAERRRLRQPWQPGGPGRPSTGGGASRPPGQRRWSGCELRDQAGAGGAAGCGSTVPGRPVQVLNLVGILETGTWCVRIQPEGRGGRMKGAEGEFLAAQASQGPVRFDASISFWLGCWE